MTNSEDSEADGGPEVLNVRLEPNDMLDMVRLGLRRAASFMGMGLVSLKGEPPKSLTTSGFQKWQFVPEPTTPEFIAEMTPNYVSWLTGAALREVGQHFSAMLDITWLMLEWSDLNGRIINSPINLKGIDAETNSSKKLRLVLERLELDLEEVPYYHSISRARNDLTHGLGLARPIKSLPDETSLTVRWTAFVVALRQGETVNFADHDSEFLEAPDPSNGSRLELHCLARENMTAFREPIRLSAPEVNEIFFMFHRTTFRMVEAMKAFLIARGLPPHPPAGS